MSSTPPEPTENPVSTVQEFRGYDEENATFAVPEAPNHRKPTNMRFFKGYLLWLFVQLPFMAYGLAFADLRRITHGYDNCGNICGIDNRYLNGIACTGRNLTHLSYLMVVNVNDTKNRTCVEFCQPDRSFHCYSDPNDISWSESLVYAISRETAIFLSLPCIGIGEISTSYVITGFVPGFCILFVVTFHFFVRFFVWFILIGSMIVLVAKTVLDVCVDMEENIGDAIGINLLVLAFLAFVIQKRKQIVHCMYFFEEANNAIIAMPLLLFSPLLTLSFFIAIISTFVYVSILIMGTAGTLTETGTAQYDYVRDVPMELGFWFSLIIVMWTVFITLGLQQMVIAGAVAARYFRNEDKSAIWTSFSNSVRFHLGSITMGSLLLTIGQMFNLLVKNSSMEGCCGVCFEQCIVGCGVDGLKNFTPLAYTEVAIHGQPLYKSSKRALSLISEYTLDTIVLAELRMAFFLLTSVVFTMLHYYIGVYLLEIPAIVLAVTEVIIYLYSHCFFTIFQTATDATLICYCEDRSSNSGEGNAYFYSDEFHEHIQSLMPKPQPVSQSFWGQLNDKLNRLVFLEADEEVLITDATAA